MILALVIWSFLFLSCDAINPQDGDLVDYTCEGCHTNVTALDKIINDLVLDPPDEGHAAPG